MSTRSSRPTALAPTPMAMAGPRSGSVPLDGDRGERLGPQHRPLHQGRRRRGRRCRDGPRGTRRGAGGPARGRGAARGAAGRGRLCVTAGGASARRSRRRCDIDVDRVDTEPTVYAHRGRLERRSRLFDRESHRRRRGTNYPALHRLRSGQLDMRTLTRGRALSRASRTEYDGCSCRPSSRRSTLGPTYCPAT